MKGNFKKSYYGITLLLSISFLIVSCNSREWVKADKNALLERCKSEGGSKKYCKCYLENAMAEFNDASEMEDIDFETAVELSIDCN